MRRLRVACLFVCSVVGASTAGACGDDDAAPVPPKDGGPNDAGVDVDPFADAIVPDEDAGLFVVEDVADAPCVARADSGKLLYAAADVDPVVALTAFGARRLAQRSTGGFVLLDADGSNASATKMGQGVSSAAVDDTRIASVASDGSGPVLTLFDGNGATIGSARAFETSTTGVAVGGRSSAALMVWGSPFGVFARGIVPSGFISPAFPLSGSGAVQGFRASVVRKDDGSFGVAFSGETVGTAEESRLSFIRATTTGRIATGFNLQIGASPQRLVQLAARPGGGWAVLVEYGKGLVAHLVLLDEEGRIEGKVFRLRGAGGGYGIAMSGDEIGVLALHEPEANDAGAPDAGDDAGDASVSAPYRPIPAFRPFDRKGAPLGGWVCLGDGTTANGLAGAIIGEDNGYAVTYPRANGDVVYDRFDRRGN